MRWQPTSHNSSTIFPLKHKYLLTNHAYLVLYKVYRFYGNEWKVLRVTDYALGKTHFLPFKLQKRFINEPIAEVNIHMKTSYSWNEKKNVNN